MGTRRLLARRGAPEQITRSITTAALSPRSHRIVVIAIARRPKRSLDTLGRAVQAKLNRGGIGAG